MADSYVVIRSRILLKICKSAIDNIKMVRTHKQHELIKETMEGRNKWRRRFFMRPLSADEVEKDLKSDPRIFTEWDRVSEYNYRLEDVALLLINAAKAVREVHVNVDDFWYLKKWAYDEKCKDK